MTELPAFRAIAMFDPDAVRGNAACLVEELGGRAQLCAVVKADGYGHGAGDVASAAIAGGDVTPPAGALLTPAQDATVAAGAPLAVTGWAIDADGQAPVVEIAVDGVVAASVTDGTTPQAEGCKVASSVRCPNVGFAASVTAPLASGPHEIAAQARDAAGNVRVIGRVEVVVP